MDNPLYVKLSALMFMEYAVWGAWMPVLAARLLGPLKMTGKQTGWIYSTLPLGTMISPLLAGQLADKYVDTGWILAVAHLAGAVLLFAASRIQKFGPLFIVMLLYSMFYGATIPLVNSLMFTHLKGTDIQAPSVFIWAPIAWALVGYLLTGWRMTRKAEGDGSDCLVFAAALSIVMVVVCLLQPATPPQGGSGVPMLKAFSMLSQVNFLVFILVSLVVAGMMQFYFLGTAQFMQDRGIASKAVPASMAVAQAAQALATFFLLGLLYNDLAGPKWTLVLGTACWLAMYMVYVLSGSRLLLIACQALHGLAYVFFIIAGQMFTNDVADPKIVASAQALIILVTTGIGLFLGTQLAGVVMDRNASGGRFDWKKIYAVPLLCMLAGLIALAVAVRDPKPADAPAGPVDEGTTVAAAVTGDLAET
ncbi:MAG: MFS transporter [Thermoguttaceae bacterium]